MKTVDTPTCSLVYTISDTRTPVCWYIGHQNENNMYSSLGSEYGELGTKQCSIISVIEMIDELNTCHFQLCQYRNFNLCTDHPIVSCILSNNDVSRATIVNHFLKYSFFEVPLFRTISHCRRF